MVLYILFFHVQSSPEFFYSGLRQSSRGLWVDVCGQLEVFKGVEGDVSVVHHGEDHRNVPATEGQQLDGPQVGNGAVETGSEAQAELIETDMIQIIQSVY